MSFEEIYKTYWQKIFRLCMGYVNNYDWAKDIAQDSFVTVWQQLPKFRNEAAVSTWVFRIASNQCLRQLEKQNRLPKAILPTEIKEELLPDTESKTQYLYQCIAQLPETERIIILLELEDVKQAEIAVITGLTEANVRVKIYRIKEKLTEKFKNYER